MAYKALYRSYRPQTFSDVVDQKPIVRTLQNAIIHNKVAHAYLFCGPRGTGKTTLAKIFAKALNCEHGPIPNPCDACSICNGITNGSIQDVVEIDAASNNGADDIRVLRDSVKFLPSKCRYKVYIIDEVHMLSNAAFNALLKTLEEPPTYVVFILATTEPYKLPDTILSRCQRYDFQSISDEGIKNRIRYVCENEEIEISDEAIMQIVNASDGGMRDALSLLDQVISYISEKKITLDDVLTISGDISTKDLLKICQELYNHNVTTAMDLVTMLQTQGKEVTKICLDLTMFLRDILLVKMKINPLVKPIFEEDSTKEIIDKIPNQLIYHWIDLLNETQNQMRFSNQKRSFLDLTLLKMSDMKLREENELLDRINRLELLIDDLEKKLESSKNQEIKIVPSSTKNISNIIKNKELETKTNIDVELERVEQPLTTASNLDSEANNYISIEQINDILNNGNKEIREKVVSNWGLMQIKYSDLMVANILFNGKVVACSSEGLLVVLSDQGFCERVMSYVNYIKILEILQNQVSSLTFFLAIPYNIWQEIRKDYKQKYDNGILKPILEKIQIPVHMPVKPNLDLKDEVIEKLENIFEENLKILEE